MLDCDNVILICSEYVLSEIKSIKHKSSDDILMNRTDASHFTRDLIEYNWKPLADLQVSSVNRDLLTDLTLKKVISDILTSDGESAAAEENDSQLIEKLEIIAYVLDFCFHSRTSRIDRTAWTTTYFDLLGLTMNLLSWPVDISKFWTYTETRIEWFKLQNFANEEEFSGASSLISYKPPMSDKLRHWNDLLKVVHYNSALNTPLHYIMKHKLEKFISDLLPINEESNFNRSATVAKSQDSGNSWNKKRHSGRPTSPKENLAQDYRFVQTKFILSPIEFALKPLNFKLDIQDALFSMLDALFDVENEYYRNAKYTRRTKLEIEDKINQNLDSDFDVNSTTLPTYLKNSKKFEYQRHKLWKEMLSFQDSSNLMIRSTFLDISSNNDTSLYKQLTLSENDYFRKQFILQVIFACRVVEKLLSEEDIKAYYKNCYAKDDLLQYFSFDDLDETNIKKTKSMCQHVTETRISSFYMTRDPSFYRIIHSLLKSDDSYLVAKIDNFKCFSNFNLSLVRSSENKEDTIDYNFKKFGFIKLGNKQINNVWKIQNGLESVSSNDTNPKNIYEKLKENLTSDSPNTQEKDKIVKQWQTLRLLRSQYLFEFNKVNEEASLEGLFDQNLVEKSLERQENNINAINTKINEGHRMKLKEAREYLKRKEELKRKADEMEKDGSDEDQSNVQKKMKTEDIATNTQQNPKVEPTATNAADEAKDETKEDTPVATIAPKIADETKEDTPKETTPVGAVDETKEETPGETGDGNEVHETK